MTYRATKLDPPRINESPEQLFKWRQRVFELLNGINTILADGIEISPAPIGQITADNVQDLVTQVESLISALQDNLATTVVPEDSFGLPDDTGTSTVFAREDHTHGSPDDPIPAHVGEADPHIQYQKESEKGQASGYASLGVTALVPMTQLATGTPNGTLFIRDDNTLAAPPSADTGYAKTFLLMGG